MTRNGAHSRDHERRGGAHSPKGRAAAPYPLGMFGLFCGFVTDLLRGCLFETIISRRHNKAPGELEPLRGRGLWLHGSSSVRRVRDLNPGAGLSRHTISSRAH